MADTEVKTMNIYQKMLKATEKIATVAKNLDVGIGKNQYKAVGEADVLRAVKPIEAELGIYSFPLSRKIVDTNVFTTVSEYNGSKSEKNNQFLRIETVYRFINVEQTEDYIDITTYGDGVDSQDKAPGKAMTYSDKYALLKAYKINTGEDPDQDASQDGKFSKKVSKSEEQQAQEGAKKSKEQKAEEEAKKISQEKVKKNNVDALLMKMKKKGVEKPKICAKYGVCELEDLTLENWQSAMNKLEKTPDKEQEDLGLV